MLWLAPHPCQAQTRGRAGGEDLAGEERPGAAGALSARTQPAPSPHTSARRAAARDAWPGGPWTPWGSQAAPVLGGSLGSAPPAPEHGWGSFPPLPSHTPVVLHEHLVINSIIIQLLLPTPKYIAQSKLAEIH